MHASYALATVASRRTNSSRDERRGQVRRLVDSAVQTFGRVGVVISNAGLMRRGEACRERHLLST